MCTTISMTYADSTFRPGISPHGTRTGAAIRSSLSRALRTRGLISPYALGLSSSGTPSTSICTSSPSPCSPQIAMRQVPPTIWLSRVRTSYSFLLLQAAWLAEPPEGDGESERLTARLSYGVPGEVRQLLVLADHLEVLDPPEARAELAAAAASVTSLYQGRVAREA